MKKTMLAGVLLLCSMTALAKVKDEDFKYSATVLRTDAIPGYGVNVWVQIGDEKFYLSEGCLTHCHLLATGTVLRARTLSGHRMQLMHADEGNKVMTYGIKFIGR
jgi:hypothetical protein